MRSVAARRIARMRLLNKISKITKLNDRRIPTVIANFKSLSRLRRALTPCLLCSSCPVNLFQTTISDLSTDFCLLVIATGIRSFYTSAVNTDDYF